MQKPEKGRKVALVVGLALVVLSAGVVWTFRRELKSWYALWHEFESLGRNAQGYPEYRHRKTGIVFVALPGGTFEMGSPETEEGRETNEGPVHEVVLSPFLIAKYEVSQAEWKRSMGNGPSEFQGDALPVENVSWDGCEEFCAKSGLSLPTEAQWEFACRAGTRGPYAGTGKLDEMGWYSLNRRDWTQPVGEKSPNQFGLHDMHGNVSEWCLDWYGEKFYSRSAASGRNPLCQMRGPAARVLRGGSWSDGPRLCRSAFRAGRPPSDRNDLVGFRPAWSRR